VRYYGDQSAQVNAVRIRNRVAFCIAGPGIEPTTDQLGDRGRDLGSSELGDTYNPAEFQSTKRFVSRWGHHGDFQSRGFKVAFYSRQARFHQLRPALIRLPRWTLERIASWP